MKNRLASVPYKNFDIQIAIIVSIDNIEVTNVTIIGHEECNAHIIKTANDFVLKVDGIYDNRQNGNEIPIILEGKNCVVKVTDAFADSFHADILSGISRTQTFDIKNIDSSDFSKDRPSKFRSFFPTDIDKMKSFTYMFETVNYQNGRGVYAFDCISIEVGGIKYDISKVEREDQGYYIIESLVEETYKVFKEKCYAIQQSLGFLLGYMPGGEEYLFVGDTFAYSRFVRPALRSIYNPVNSNPYARLRNKEEAALYEGKLTEISSDVFSNFVQLLREKESLSMAVTLLLEAVSVKSLLLIPSVFAVIIEVLAKGISVSQKGKIAPIKDKELGKNIIDQLLFVIDANSEKLTAKGSLKLKERILNLNNPINRERLTNDEKLTAPFNQLGIKLTLQDILAIKHRNDLLHGNISLDNGDERSDAFVNNYMMHIMDRLYTLISKLLLKCAGYNGYIINHPKFTESRVGITTDEGYYVEI